MPPRTADPAVDLPPSSGGDSGLFGEVEEHMSVSPNTTGTSGILIAVAQHDTEVLEGLLKARIDNLDASGLDPRTYALVNIAALIAADAAPSSYVFQIGLALESGVTAEEILGLLIALNPTIGNVRIVAAAAEIAFALGDLEAQAEADGQ
jgi:alkylhydroperoxidase/carboxymuconolactone decarboxylase family protein YurZ